MKLVPKEGTRRWVSRQTQWAENGENYIFFVLKKTINRHDNSKNLGNDEIHPNRKLVSFQVIQRVGEKANEVLPDFEG